MQSTVCCTKIVLLSPPQSNVVVFLFFFSCTPWSHNQIVNICWQSYLILCYINCHGSLRTWGLMREQLFHECQIAREAVTIQLAKLIWKASLCLNSWKSHSHNGICCLLCEEAGSSLMPHKSTADQPPFIHRKGFRQTPAKEIGFLACGLFDTKWGVLIRQGDWSCNSSYT